MCIPAYTLVYSPGVSAKHKLFTNSIDFWINVARGSDTILVKWYCCHIRRKLDITDANVSKFFYFVCILNNSPLLSISSIHVVTISGILWPSRLIFKKQFFIITIHSNPIKTQRRNVSQIDMSRIVYHDLICRIILLYNGLRCSIFCHIAHLILRAFSKEGAPFGKAPHKQQLRVLSSPLS